MTATQTSKRGLASQLLLVFLVVEGVTLFGGGMALWTATQLDDHIHTLDRAKIPILNSVADATRQQMEQSMRMGEILLHAQVANRAKVELSNEGFIQAGKRFTESLREGRNLVQSRLDRTPGDGERPSLEMMLEMLVDLEKVHSDFEHLGAEIIRGIYQFEFITKHQRPAGSTPLDELAKRHQGFLEQSLSQLEDETKRLEDKLSETTHLAQQQVRHLTSQSEGKQAQALWVFLLSGMMGLAVAAVSLVAITLAHSRQQRHAALQILKAGQELADQLNQLSVRDEERHKTGRGLQADGTALAREVDGIMVLVTGLGQHARQESLQFETSGQFAGESSRLAHDMETRADQFATAARQVIPLGEDLVRRMRELASTALQVNLLATNASAEAARSEATRSFAIFSTEIKTLAQKCADTSQEIGDRLETVVKTLQSGETAALAARQQAALLVEQTRQLQTLAANMGQKAEVRLMSVTQAEQAGQTLLVLQQRMAAMLDSGIFTAEEMTKANDLLASLMLLAGDKRNRNGETTSPS